MKYGIEILEKEILRLENELFVFNHKAENIEDYKDARVKAANKLKEYDEGKSHLGIGELRELRNDLKGINDFLDIYCSTRFHKIQSKYSDQIKDLKGCIRTILAVDVLRDIE